MSNPIDRGEALTADVLQAMKDATADSDPDLALKDATHVYSNGVRAFANVHLAVTRLRDMRRVNGIDAPVVLQRTPLLPLGGMAYFAGDKLFAFDIDPMDAAPQ